MEILKNFNDNTFELIADNTKSFELPETLNLNDVIKLSVLTDGGVYQSDYILEQNKDFYIKNQQVFLKPNEVLDRNNFTEGNYTLQFDFLTQWPLEELYSFYISEISPSRKEIRLKLNPLGSGEIDSTGVTALKTFFDEEESYGFNSFLEISQGRLLTITNYAFDSVTDNTVSLILKFDNAIPNNVNVLSTDFTIVNKFFASQTQDIFFIDREGLAISGFGLDIDEGYINDSVEVTDDVRTYNSLTSSIGTSLIEDFNRNKKDLNLNIDYSKFENHAFFGSAKRKLQNFKDKAIKLEGLYKKLSDSLSVESTAKTTERRSC